jgi:non-heme chloroperoxidase
VSKLSDHSGDGYVESFDGTRIAYRRAGSGPSIVLLPGINFSAEVWDMTFAALVGAFDLVAVDPRGHGASGKPAGSYAYDLHTRDLAAVVDALGLEEFTLVGWSLGGAIALHYASQGEPLGRLMLCSPAAPRFTAAPDFEHALPEDAVRGLMERERIDRPAYRRWVIEQSLHQEASEETLSWLWNLSMQTPSWASLSCLEALIAEDLRDSLTSVAVPTCVVRGAHDGFVMEAAAAMVAEEIPDCELVVFGESGHMAFFEQPDRFNSLLRDFASAKAASR